MVARCQMILGDNPKEIEANVDGAIGYYNRCKLPLYSTRLIFYYYEYLKSKGLFKEATSALLRGSAEVSSFVSYIFERESDPIYLFVCLLACFETRMRI